MTRAQALVAEASERLAHPEDKIVRVWDGPKGYSLTRIDQDGRYHPVTASKKRRRSVKA